MKNLLDTGDALSIPAAARSAEGVLPTLSEMVKMILQKLRDTPLGEEEQPSVVAERHALAEEPAREQQETPEPAAIAEETAIQEPAAEEEPHLLNEGLVEEEILPAEEPVVSSWSAESTEDIPAPSVDDTLTFEMESEGLAGPDIEGFDKPEPESWTRSLSPTAEVAESEAKETQPEIALDGTLESLGDGRYRLPIVIRFADKEIKTGLTLSLGFE